MSPLRYSLDMCGLRFGLLYSFVRVSASALMVIGFPVPMFMAW